MDIRLHGGKALNAALALLLVATLLAACAPAPASPAPEATSAAPADTAAPAPATAAPAEPIKLTIWWWGEQEAPGAQKFMDETVAMYQKEHPNITVEAVLQSTDNLIPSFQSAIAAGTGPDIEYVWAGIYTLDFVWANGLQPINGLIPESEYKHYINNFERDYDGKLWGVPWYLSGNPLVYNKKLFSQAGLDPNAPPRTWDEFISACKKLRAANVTPVSGGFKDGWYGGWLGSILGRQNADSYKEFMVASVGNAKFTDPKFSEWWTRLKEMKDAGCWNDDAMSIDQYQGLDMFVQGKSAMVLGNDTFIGNWIKTLGDDLGVMLVPKYGTGKMADEYVVTAQGFAISSWSKHPQEAADFLVYLHTPERLAAWYKYTGVLPADDRLDASLITQTQIQQLYKWDTTVAGANLENFVPILVDQEGWWSGVQLILSGTKTPEEVAAMVEETAQKYRDQNPDAIKNWAIWMK